MRQQADILHAHRHLDPIVGGLGHERLEVERSLDRARDRDPLANRVLNRSLVRLGVLDQHCRLEVGKDNADPIGRQPVVYRR